ncbi:MAG: cytochrome c [Cocleimonas sp.]
MSKHLVKKLSIAAGLVLVMNSSVYADGAALYTSKGCAACHGADAKSPIMPAYPKIAGQSKKYLTQQMVDIKTGARSNGQSATMKGIMAGISDDEIAEIAVYISGL